ncbi:hypothetical protein CERSUDRAFT_92940 [Gelatoporia subvermispora B]|uniref:DUF4219 domain-containing protein n=1 Tax=Ceriporiopsis subvermispora (strain B) TaxID=914234 RepID=M2RJB9_CERS8|nr:hypothetical protein CERSUDRAFT_92940 [Gelatoporia subvermispora B]
MSSNSFPTVPKLNFSNYGSWCQGMQAWLRTEGLWCLDQGSLTKAHLSATSEVFTTPGTIITAVNWDHFVDKAAGSPEITVIAASLDNGTDQESGSMYISTAKWQLPPEVAYGIKTM